MPAAMMSRSDGKSAPAFRPSPTPKPSSPPGAANTTRSTPPPWQSGVEKSSREKPGTTPDAKTEQKILYQTFFKSVGTRTYAAQVKEAGNGNHFILLTEGRRDEKTGEVRKSRVLVFSEDFQAFAKLFADTMLFVRE